MKTRERTLYAEARAKALRLEYGVSQGQKENFMCRGEWESVRGSGGGEHKTHGELLSQEKNLDLC